MSAASCGANNLVLCDNTTGLFCEAVNEIVLWDTGSLGLVLRFWYKCPEDESSFGVDVMISKCNMIKYT